MMEWSDEVEIDRACPMLVKNGRDHVKAIEGRTVRLHDDTEIQADRGQVFILDISGSAIFT